MALYNLSKLELPQAGSAGKPWMALDHLEALLCRSLQFSDVDI